MTSEVMAAIDRTETEADGPADRRLPAAVRIQQAARELFLRQGIRATGVEEIVRAAGATKMSLYRAFPSKDALIAAILAEDMAGFEAWLDGLAAAAPTPSARLRVLIDALAEDLRNAEPCDCPLMLAQAEFRQRDELPHREVCRHKARARGLLAALAQEAGAADPEALGDQVAMLIDGAWTAVPSMGGPRAAEVFAAAAGAVLAAALPSRAA